MDGWPNGLHEVQLLQTNLSPLPPFPTFASPFPPRARWDFWSPPPNNERAESCAYAAGRGPL